MNTYRYRKNIPCRYYNLGYCNKTASQCDFGHFKSAGPSNSRYTPADHYTRTIPDRRSPSVIIYSRSVSTSPNGPARPWGKRSRSKSRSPRRQARSRSRSPRRLARSRSPEKAGRSKTPRSSKSPRSPYHGTSLPNSKRISPGGYSPARWYRDSESPIVKTESPKRFVSTYNDPQMLASLSASLKNQSMPGCRAPNMLRSTKNPPPRFTNLVHAKYLMENSLKNTLEMADLSLLGPVPDEIKGSFECWLWQKE